MPLKTEFETGLPNHRKTWLLASKLGHNFTAVAVGIIHNLHDWAVDSNIRDGVLPDQPDGLWERIFCAGLPAKTIINALVESGWIDRDGDKLTLHQWSDYAGSVFGRMDASAKRKAEYRDKIRSSRTSPHPVPSVSHGQGEGRDNIHQSPTTTHHSPSTIHHDHSPSPKSLSVVSVSKPASENAPVGLEDTWGSKPPIRDAWEAADRFWQALPAVKVYQAKGGSRPPPAVKFWFEGKQPRDWDEAIAFAESFAAITAAHPEWSYQTIPKAITMLEEGWTAESIEARARPLASNREAKLVGQIGPRIATAEEFEQEAREHAAAVRSAREAR